MKQLQGVGVRVIGKTIISPFSTRDSAAKCALINLMIEKAGYTLSDGKGIYVPIEAQS